MHTRTHACTHKHAHTHTHTQITETNYKRTKTSSTDLSPLPNTPQQVQYIHLTHLFHGFLKVGLPLSLAITFPVHFPFSPSFLAPCPDLGPGDLGPCPAHSPACPCPAHGPGLCGLVDPGLCPDPFHGLSLFDPFCPLVWQRASILQFLRRC